MWLKKQGDYWHKDISDRVQEINKRTREKHIFLLSSVRGIKYVKQIMETLGADGKE